jgi:transcription initiation factor TFIIB
VTLDDGRAEYSCEDCGLVLSSDVIDHGPEWRSFDDETDRSRVGAPTTPSLHDRGLSTDIGWRDVDARGSELSPQRRRQLQRLRTWNRRMKATGGRERNLQHALGEIHRMSSALAVPESVRESASVLYRRALESDLLPGRSIEAMATAALYAAARRDGVPRPVDEVAAVSRVDRLEFLRAYRYLVRELGLAVAPTDPEAYLGRMVSRLDVSTETARQARELVRAATAEGVHSGRNPVGIAASAVYAAGRLTNADLTQSQVAEAAGVTEMTIRNRYGELLEAAAGRQPSLG